MPDSSNYQNVRDNALETTQAFEMLGRYLIEDVLGRGGEAVVYRGWDPVLSRPVAIKKLSWESTSSDLQESRVRLQREAQILATLTHPQIVKAFDSGEDHGIPYLVMEFLEGKSASEVLQVQQTFPIGRIITVVEQVALALDYVHTQGIIHCDVKPANLMLVQSGLVKLIDFGIATSSVLPRDRDSGKRRGSPNYMAPEQVLGGIVDARTDVFALGITLYELLTGKRPFAGHAASTVMHNILCTDPIDMRQFATIIPEACVTSSAKLWRRTLVIATRPVMSLWLS